MSQQTDLPWISEARKYIGLSEIPGKQHNSIIRNWLIALKAWYEDDETPWCGTFVAHCARHAGRDIPQHWYRALDWLNTGTSLKRPAFGCVVVFSRQGGGHVGFVVGQTKNGDLMVLGGNQNNRVSIAKFARTRAVGFIWLSENGQKNVPKSIRYQLPLCDSNGAYCTNVV